MTVYYNEFDESLRPWLENLMSAGAIPRGDIDTRSIEDVRPSDLRGYTQCHFFAGIGGWAYALALAGWPSDQPVWTGSCPCFPAGTLVLTRRGYLCIEEVAVGDEVLTHRGRWRPVTATGSEYAYLVRVKGQGHWGMLTTANHPFLTGDDEWTEAGELAGKRWRTVASVPALPVPALENQRGVMLDRGAWRVTGWKDGRTIYLGRYATEEEARARRVQAIASGEIDVRGADGANPTTLGFARFLGYWVGDGWTCSQSVFLCGDKTDGPLLEEILRGAGLQFGLSIERTTMRARLGSRALVRWLNENFGATAAGKRLPAWLHGMPPEWRSEFLRGYGEADGHSEQGVKRFTTVSRAIAVGVRVLMNQQGVSASITWHRTPRQRIEGREVSAVGGFYRVTAYQRARSFSFNELHGVGYVRTVEPAGQGRVFNIAVAEDESYTADGIAVHNCQPFSSAGQGAGFADERHLWPAFHHLIRECRPAIVLGEQVASPDALRWFDLVQADLDGADYASAAADLCSAGTGLAYVETPEGASILEWIQRAAYACPDPELAERIRDFAEWFGREIGAGGYHIRQRLYWMAHAQSAGGRQDHAEPGRCGDAGQPWAGSCGGGELGRLVQPNGTGSQQGIAAAAPAGYGRSAESAGADVGGLAHAGCSGSPQQPGRRHEPARSAAPSDPTIWLLCLDSKWRPASAESGAFPLAYGVPRDLGRVQPALAGMARGAGRNRRTRLHGYGNAIGPRVAAGFVRAVMECMP